MLFLVNLSMDYLTILLTARLTHGKPHLLRMGIASVFGALYGTLAVVYSLRFAFLGTALVSVLMTLVAFGRQRGVLPLLRQSGILWGCGALLGGIVSGLMALGEPVFLGDGDGQRSGFLWVYVLTVGAAVTVIRLFSSRGERKSASVEVTVCGETVSFEALCDSGNLLRDPLSGVPVIPCAAEVFGEETRAALGRFRDGGETSEGLRFRVIPHETLSGGGVLYGIIPDEVKVNGAVRSAVVAPVEGGKREGYGGFSGIVPSCLCR